MSATDGACLVWYQGAAAGSDVDGGLAVQRVPHHSQRQAHQAEGDGALDRAAGAVAGLTDPGHLAGLLPSWSSVQVSG